MPIFTLGTRISILDNRRAFATMYKVTLSLYVPIGSCTPDHRREGAIITILVPRVEAQGKGPRYGPWWRLELGTKAAVYSRLETAKQPLNQISILSSSLHTVCARNNQKYLFNLKRLVRLKTPFHTFGNANAFGTHTCIID